MRWPQELVVGERFDATVEFANTSERPQLLHSIEVDRDMLLWVEIESTEPAFTKIKLVPFANRKEYIFERTIPAQGRLEVRFRILGRLAGSVNSTLGVCINSETNCVDYDAPITVVTPTK
jgi:hypothetical protein